LVGRDRELADVRAAVAGEARVVVLAGPAGVGKSRLAKEALRGLDLAVVDVRANRSAGSIPLGALAPVLPPLTERDARARDLVERAAEAVAAHRGGASGLVVAVDDGHELDDLSAEVLVEASRAPNVVLLVTVREVEPLPPPLVASTNDLEAVHLSLGPLDREATGRLLEAALGGPVDGAAQREVWERSRGNALYLRELVLGAVEHDVLVEDGGLWRIAEPLAATPRLAELVDARLSDLGAAERQVVELVAFGEPIVGPVVRMLADADALEEVVRRGLIVADDDEAELLRLAHPLYGEVLRATMPSIRALRINRMLADTADASAAGLQDVDALRLAVWRLDGGGTGDPALLTRGAEQAHVAHDDLLAERLARAALAAGAGVQAGLVLAASLVEQGRHEEAHGLFADLAERDLSNLERVVLAKRWAETLYWGLSDRVQADAVLDAAMAHLADDSESVNELLARRAMFHQQAAEGEGDADDLSAILAGPEGRAFCEAAITAGFDLAAKGRTEEAEALTRRAFAVQWGIEDQFGLLHPGSHISALAFALTEAGRLDEAEHVATATGYEVALALHLSYGQAWMALMLGRIALDRGRPVLARQRFQESARVFAEVGQNGPRSWALAGLALATSFIGSADEAEAAIVQLDAAPNTMSLYRLEGERARAWVHARRGELTDARDRLAKEAEGAEHVATALAARAWHDVARLGDGERAAPAMARIVAVTDGELIPARAVHVQGLATSDPNLLEEAGERFAGLGALLLAAEAHHAAAEASRRAGLRAKATTAERRADELLAQCEGASTPTLRLTATANVLTRREQEVAGLGAEGLSNQEIADRLAVSVRTVENHLQRAYEKLGIAGRDELRDALGA
jgi:DNA-binding CsgD family transcriptional regulator